LILDGDKVVKTHLMVMNELKDYASPRARLTRLLKSGKLIQLRRGLFVDTPSMSRRVIAPILYGPSYISFQYALAALIPERTPVISSASFYKNKNKVFHTPLGEYRYYYLPSAVYPYGITMEMEDGAAYLIATPEKALCDMVYKTPDITSIAAMNKLLIENWRIERDDLLKLDYEFIEWIAPRYRRKSLNALSSWFRREHKR
jgi:phage terminase large subunit-like protein